MCWQGGFGTTGHSQASHFPVYSLCAKLTGTLPTFVSEWEFFEWSNRYNSKCNGSKKKMTKPSLIKENGRYTAGPQVQTTPIHSFKKYRSSTSSLDILRHTTCLGNLHTMELLLQIHFSTSHVQPELILWESMTVCSADSRQLWMMTADELKRIYDRWSLRKNSNYDFVTVEVDFCEWYSLPPSSYLFAM